MPRPGYERIRPEPAGFWVRWAPRRWPGPAAPFVDLARGRLAGTPLRRSDARPAPPAGPIDVVYLPPVRAEAEAWRAETVERARAAGHGVRVQAVAGEAPPAGSEPPVVDLAAVLLAGGELGEAVNGLGPAAGAVWPLIPGLTDGAELLRAGCEALKAAGVSAVQGVVPELTPGERRELSRRGGERLYQALFHGPPPAPARLARAALEAGLAPWLPRPPLPGPVRGRNRALAEHLALLGEWQLLVGRPEGAAQALFRAARWVDGEPRDVAAIAGEGNLQIVGWLEKSCRRAIERFVAGKGEEALAEMAAELTSAA